jgi:hypothetical protein
MLPILASGVFLDGWVDGVFSHFDVRALNSGCSKRDM